MLPENITAIIARNEHWSGRASSEPFEAGWAREVIIFVRALDHPVGEQPIANVELSPDGMHWMEEGSTIALPAQKDAIACARITHYGNWLRVSAEFSLEASSKVLITVHAKA